MWLFRLLVIIAVVVAVWYVVRAVRAGGGIGAVTGQSDVSFTPVEELPRPERLLLDGKLEQGDVVAAVKHYRAATGATQAQAKAAVDTYRWKIGEGGEQ